MNKCKPADNYFSVKIDDDSDSKERVLEKLKHFNNKVLIIHGANDFVDFSNPVKNHYMFPNSELKMLNDVGHMMAIDSKEMYFSTINTFLTND